MSKRLFSVFFIIAFAPLAYANETGATLAGIIGHIEVKTDVKAKWEPAREGMALTGGALIATGFNSRAAVVTQDSAIIIGSLSRADVRITGADAEQKQVVVTQEPVNIRAEALIPLPPIGFGENERVKIDMPRYRTYRHNQETAAMLVEDAGFKPALTLPKTTQVVIHIILE